MEKKISMEEDPISPKNDKDFRWHRLDLRDETDPFSFYAKCTNENDRRVRQSQDGWGGMGHPLVVSASLLFGGCVFIWGLIAWKRYISGQVTHLGEIWWQTSVTMAFLVVTGILLPPRIRFSCNWYGIVTFALLAQYAIFMCFYPLSFPSGEELQQFHTFTKRQKNKID